jgi:hypothetical protein
MMDRSIEQTARAFLCLAAMLLHPAASAAQTDYYNTDSGRPLQIEDAYPVERRAFEIQAAPLRLERATGGAYHWSVEPELAFGILPRTQVEVGVPISFIDGAGVRRSGFAGLDLSALYNLNVETTRFPAMGIAASALLPLGSLAPDDPYVTFKAIATRTSASARFHLNAEYTAGDDPPATASQPMEVPRWTAGIAVDRTFPLRSILIGGEVVVQQPLASADDLVVILGAGARYQLAPRWAVDGGLGKKLAGDDRGWYVTLGSAYAFGLPWHP